MQPAGGGVGAAAELAPRVQPGHDQLHAGQLGLALDVDRDAPAVVPDFGRTVRVQDHVDPGAVSAQRLIHRVVDDLPQAVLQAAAVGRPDVHARTLAHRVQALQDRQVPGGIGGVARGVDGQPGGGAGGGAASGGNGSGANGGHGRADLLPEMAPRRGLSNRVAFPAGCRVHATRRSPRKCFARPLSGICDVETHGACVPPGHAPGGTRAPRVRAGNNTKRPDAVSLVA